MINTDQLFASATEIMKKAYVPYSHFPVGASLLTTDGQIISGCNIENASYGLTNCAERTALFTALAAGQTKFAALMVTGNTDGPISPCGACRQVISELCDSQMPVFCSNQAGEMVELTVSQLLPGAFKTEDLTNNE